MTAREFCPRCQRKIIDGACRCPREAAPVDVLAVLHHVAVTLDLEGDEECQNARDDLSAVRAAVAELIEAAGKVAARELPPVNDANASEQFDVLGLRAALARCKGGAA